MIVDPEAIDKIQEAKSRASKSLYLNSLGLTEIPLEIAQLTHLRELYLYDNHIQIIPKELAQLTQLQNLYLYDNQIQQIPRELAQLEQLQHLDLSNNQIGKIPKELGLLSQLQTLSLFNNQIQQIPKELGNLNQLQILSLYNNRIQKIPKELSRLAQLQQLDLSGNQIEEIPKELALLSQARRLDLSGNRIQQIPKELALLAQLQQLILVGNQLQQIPKELARIPQLERLDISNNPIIFPPPEIVAQGHNAIRAFLRGQLDDSRREWVSKLILVGEGGVGKTCLLRALRGEAFNLEEDKTDGIWIDELNLKHPSEPGVTMKLKTWDFGGQQIYHATHQFFLTERSLYVLVWNARVGYEQSKLEYWLKNIQAKAPESPILLVSTHIDQHSPDLPFRELQEKFPRMIGQWQVSNSTGEGVSLLLKNLCEIAANSLYLPLMGESWPKTWLDAADWFRSQEIRGEKCIQPERFEQMAIEKGVKKEDVPILARWLHELGDILYFKDVEKLKSRVILNPQWVTDHIFRVLNSQEVKDNHGILRRDCLNNLWDDLDEPLRELFLNLMEQFDLSYQTQENHDISVVVEHLPYDPPNFEELWEQKPARPEIAMNYRFGQDLLPGIPTWFIARTHRFTTHNHWRLGGLFADEGQNHLSLIHAFPQERCVQILVRGPYPQNFFALLKDTFDLTVKRYKGLEVRRMIPCPGHNGDPCPYEFSYDDVLEILKKSPQNPLVQCQKQWEFLNARDLLAGLAPSTLELEEKPDQEAVLQEWSVLRQREFLKTDEDAICPRLFTIQVKEKLTISRKLILQLFCEAPGQWHSTGDSGKYTITEPAKWVQTLAHHGRRIVKIAKYAVYAFKNIELDIQDMEEYLKIVEEISANMPEFEESKKERDKKEREIEFSGANSLFTKRAEGPELRALNILLNELDPMQTWGGLRKVATPQGQFLWLCEEHAMKYRL